MNKASKGKSKQNKGTEKRCKDGSQKGVLKMNSKEKKLFLMEQEEVPKALVKLGIPTMIGMMTSALYNLVDTFFVGTLGTSQTAAVSVAFPISLIMLAIGLLFGSGASSYLARLLGNKKKKEADECFSTALITAVIVSGIVIAGMLLALNPMLSLLGATETILPYAREYAVPFIIGLAFNVFNIVVTNMSPAEGATNFSMIAMLSGGITTMVLDPILIFGLNLGVRGAAIATLLSRTVSFCCYMYYLLSGKSNFHFSFRFFHPDKKLYGEIFKIGIPMLCYQLLCSAAMSVTNMQAKQYGDAAVAGIGVANRILSLGSMMLVGFLKGYQPFTGYNFGAGRYDRAKRATKLMLIWSTAFCVSIGLLLLIFHGQLMHLFSKSDAELIAVGGKVLMANAVTFMGLGIGMVYNFMFMALGRAKEGGFISISRQGLFFLPLIFILPLFLGINGVILAQPAADLLTYISVAVMIHGKKFIPEQAPAKLACDTI